MSALSEALGVRWAFLLNPYFYVIFFTPPLFLVCLYPLQRIYWKSRYFTWKAGLCFVLSVILFGVCISIGSSSGIKYVIYEDVLLERAIAQYENPPPELIRYHHADGARNTFAFALGVFYMIIFMLLWSPILLILWLIDKILTRKIKPLIVGRLLTAG